MSFRHQLRIGDRIQWDGERHTVVAFLDGAVELRSDRQRHALVELSTLASSMDFRVLTAPVATDDVVTFLDNAPPEQLKMAQERLAHLNEAVTGFREGIRALAVEGEPKIEYDPDVTTLTERIKSKAKEIGVSERTLWTYRSNYAERGLAGLLDERTVPIRPEFPRVDSRIKDALRAEIDEINQGTTISIKHLRRLVQRRLNREYPDESLFRTSSG